MKKEPTPLTTSRNDKIRTPLSYELLSNLKIITCLISCIFVMFCHLNVFALESEKDLGDYKLRNIAKIIRPSDVAGVDFKKINRLSVLVTSTSPLFGQVAEDYLTLKLRDLNYEIIDRSKFSEATIRELNKLENTVDSDKSKQQAEILSVIKIGNKLGLDALITGTLFEGRRQVSFSEENTPRFMDKTVVATFSLQIIDINTERILLSIILEYDKGENITTAIDTCIKFIKDEMKR